MRLFRALFACVILALAASAYVLPEQAAAPNAESDVRFSVRKTFRSEHDDIFHVFENRVTMTEYMMVVSRATVPPVLNVYLLPRWMDMSELGTDLIEEHTFEGLVARTELLTSIPPGNTYEVTENGAAFRFLFDADERSVGVEHDNAEAGFLFNSHGFQTDYPDPPG